MIKIVKNELIKLLSGKKLYAFLLLIVMVQLVPVAITFGTKVGAFDGQTYPVSMMGILVSWLLPLFLIILIAEIITEDYKIGMLSNTLIHPVSRAELLAGKVLFLLLLITGILLFYMVAAYILGTVFFGWDSTFLIMGMNFSTIEGIKITIGSYLISAFPLIAFSIGILLLSLTLNSSALVVGTAAGLLFAFFMAGQVSGEIRPFLINTYFSDLADLFFFAGDREEFLPAAAIVGIYGFVPYMISHYILKRRDMVS